MPANILFIDPANFIGGAELFAVDFLKHSHTFNFHLLTSGNEKYLELTKKLKLRVHIFPIPRLKPFNFKNVRLFFLVVQEILRLIREERIDLIHSNSIRAHICASFASLISRKPLIWMIHDFTFPKLFFRLLVFVPRTIIVSSESVRIFYRKLIPRRFHEKIILIPNGFDWQKIQSMHVSGNVRKELHLSDDMALVGMVGRIDWWKGQDYFIRAASKVIAKIPKTRFLIVGAASQHDPRTLEFEKNLKELVADLHLEREVLFLGYRSSALDIIRQLNVLVHASVRDEPFGRVVLEGMVVGTPVIASPFGGPKEMIEDGVNGFLVDPSDTEMLARAIGRLLEQEKLREKLISNGFRTIQKNYDLNKVVKRMEKTYEAVLQRA